MKIIALIIFLTATLASAQNISRTELRATNTALNTRISTNATAVNARIAATESTNATQTAGLTAANAAIAAANDTNATQTAAIAAANAAITAANSTNATQTAAIAALTTHAVSTSNLLAMGITNIIAGTNVTISTNNGALVISSSGNGPTSNIPVLQGTNLQFQTADFDLFNVGVLVATNTVYIARTNTATTVADGTNFVADFNYSEQIIMVTNAVNFIYATNLWIGSTNTYLAMTLMNFSGANQTLAIPAAWKESLSFPSVITNATILQLALKNYGGLSQSNILAGAAQF